MKTTRGTTNKQRAAGAAGARTRHPRDETEGDRGIPPPARDKILFKKHAAYNYIYSYTLHDDLSAINGH